MGITTKYLKDLGLTDEQVSAIFAERGKEKDQEKTEIAEIQKKLDEANQQITDFGEKVKDLDSKDATVAELQKRIADYEQSEKDRVEKEQSALAEKELNEKIEAVIGDKKFTSEYVKKGIFNDIKEQLKSDNTIGIDKAFETLTKDKEGIFVNPNQPVTIPPAGGQATKPTEFKTFF